jgi:hypothetical protein
MDITNVPVECWVDHCLLHFGMWWLVPTLIITSRYFRQCLDNSLYRKLSKTCIKTKASIFVFKSRIQGKILKNIVRKQCWILWTIPCRNNATVKLGLLDGLYNTNTLHKGITRSDCSIFGLSQSSYNNAFKLITRIAVWMYYYNMSNTELYKLFVTRMDIAFYNLKKIYPYNVSSDVSFSKYIENVIRSGSAGSWLHSYNGYPYTDRHFTKLCEIWNYGSSEQYLRIINSLPKSIQYTMMYLCTISQLSNGCSKEGILREKTKRICSSFESYVF